MKLAIILSGISLVSCFSVIQRHENIDEWHAWKSTYKRTYRNANEENKRFTIWMNNFRKIIEHNHANKNFVLKMNQFGDMTNTEYRTFKNSFFRQPENKKGSTFAMSHVSTPDSIDWRTHGYVTPVKNQEKCESSWAISAAGSLEGQLFKNSGKLVSLSAQQLVDCSISDGNEGCKGGLMEFAFNYLFDSKGIDSEESYPYTGVLGKCKYNSSSSAASIRAYVNLPQGKEPALKEGVATVGPISAYIDANHTSFQFYSGGIYNEPECNSTCYSHGVLVVGYGTENDQDYWLVKNSFGTDWGEEGYIKMSRNMNNQCGIAPTYPIVN